jgi:hypothetical protein
MRLGWGWAADECSARSSPGNPLQADPPSQVGGRQAGSYGLDGDEFPSRSEFVLNQRFMVAGGRSSRTA